MRRASVVTFAEADAAPSHASAPGKLKPPEIVHIGRDRVELIWDPPLFTGGSAITAYSIAAREGGEEGTFRTVHVTSDALCAATVRPVPSKTWLEFTVAAINGAGTGPSSRPSMPLLTYARRGTRRQRRGGGSSGDGDNGDGDARTPSHSDRRTASTASVDALLAAGARAGSVRVGTDAAADAGADEYEDDWRSEDESDDDADGAAETGDAPAAAAPATDAALAVEYEQVKGQLAALEARMSAALGRRVADEELAGSASYRALARELARLREQRDACDRAAEATRAANREWQDTLMRLGFEPGARLQQLELEQAQWHMQQTRRHGGRGASKQEQLGSREYVRLQEAILAERHVVEAAERVLDRVTSFEVLAHLMSPDELPPCMLMTPLLACRCSPT